MTNSGHPPACRTRSSSLILRTMTAPALGTVAFTSPLPLAHEVRRAEHEHTLEAGQSGRRRPDRRLASAHLANEVGGAMALEGERTGPDRVRLRAHGAAPEAPQVETQLIPVVGGVERGIGLHNGVR